MGPGTLDPKWDPKWDPSRTQLGPKWDPCWSWEKGGTLLGPKWNPTGTLLEPYWNPTGTLLGPYWDPTGTLLGAWWDQITESYLVVRACKTYFLYSDEIVHPSINACIFLIKFRLLTVTYAWYINNIDTMALVVAHWLKAYSFMNVSG